MTKQEIIDRINNINKQTLTNAVYTIESSNPVNAFTQNNVWAEWSGMYGTRHAHIAPKSRATRENLLAVYYAILDEIVCQDGLEAIREIDPEYVPDWWEYPVEGGNRIMAACEMSANVNVARDAAKPTVRLWKASSGDVWFVDYSSGSVGCTLKAFGNEADAEDYLIKIQGLDETQFRRLLSGGCR